MRADQSVQTLPSEILRPHAEEIDMENKSGRRWATPQCDYFLGQVTNRRKFCSICLQIPYNHVSNCRAIITTICAGSATKIMAYWKRLAKFLVRLPWGPQDELTTLFEELHLDVVALPTRAQLCNQWIPTPTWALINKSAALRQQGKLSQQATHLTGRQTATGHNRDRVKHAAAAADKIEGHLVAGEIEEALRCAEPQVLVQSHHQLCTKSKQDVICHPDCQTCRPVRKSGLKRRPQS
jgi:hypothetical protein